MLLWVDDMLIPSQTIDSHLESIRLLFELCVVLNFKLHPSKCILFRKRITWCGRQLTEHGIRYDPHNLSGLESMSPQSTGNEPLQFTSAMQWSRSNIPKFSTIRQPLLDALKRAYKTAGIRTKRALQRVKLRDIGWTQHETNALYACNQALQSRVTFTHRDECQSLCFYVDPSALNGPELQSISLGMTCTFPTVINVTNLWRFCPAILLRHKSAGQQ